MFSPEPRFGQGADLASAHAFARGIDKVERPHWSRAAHAAALAAILLLLPTTPAPLSYPQAPRITVVLSRDIAPYRLALAGFRKALQSEHPSPIIDVIDLARSESAAGEIAASTSLRSSRLIVAIGARAALAMKGRHASIPILIAGASGPEIEGLLRSGSSRIFGVGLQVPIDRQFETLKQVVPGALRVGVLHRRHHRSEIGRARTAARRHGLTLMPVEIASIQEIPDALRDLLDRVDALWAIPDATIYSAELAPYIILQTLRERVPFMSFSQNFVKAGALFSLYCDLEDVGMQAGQMALQVLRNGDPLPAGMTPPRTVRLALNLRVAHVIGVPITDVVRKNADVTYE